ncbi:MAG TPA: aa3-type cytochrome c oxidase subunit IV [Rhizobiaceae bacterium]|nr:aa3-type cytochrome c oxidase subunit IV [Rhizobiaceae bacterium]
MADHTPTGPVETGAQMDYEEHRKTYSLFLTLTKYGSLVCVALLIAMAFGFFTTAGFFSSLVLFLIICGVGGYLLRDMPAHIT